MLLRNCPARRSTGGAVFAPLLKFVIDVVVARGGIGRLIGRHYRAPRDARAAGDAAVERLCGALRQCQQERPRSHFFDLAKS